MIEFHLILLFCTSLFYIQYCFSFKSSTRIYVVQPSVISNFQSRFPHLRIENKQKIQYNNYNIVDDDFRSDNWWYLFTPSNKNVTFIETARIDDHSIDDFLFKENKLNLETTSSFKALSNEAKISPNDFNIDSVNGLSLPKIGAWRSVVPEDKMEKDIIPPTLMQYFGGLSDLSEYHTKRVKELYRLVTSRGSLKYLDENGSSLVFEALKIAYLGLWGKKTARSMEIAINHAKGAAAVLGELKADLDVVLASILYDLLAEFSEENLEIFKSGILKRFNPTVLDLMEKSLRLPRFMARKVDYTPEQSENMIQMLVACAEDYRCLYIRLASRIHTLRSLKSLPLEDTERIKIAQEALNVYAPLAHKMGIMKVKGELEDSAFKVINPVMFKETRLTQTSANKAYHEVATALQHIVSTDEFLLSNSIRYKLTYRIKDKFQLWLKMIRKKMSSISDVKDALGLRIIIDCPRLPNELQEDYKLRSNAVCYHIHKKLFDLNGWSPLYEGYKDYISKPKLNGYQSIHQYLVHNTLHTNVEIQIRTLDMHRSAELGEAAHWYYKDLIYRNNIANSKSYKRAWRSVPQTKAKSAAELIGIAKQQLSSSRVFVFLDDHANVINLKKGSTALDAAFSIHSELGLSVSYILVNRRLVDFNYELKNGDVICVQESIDKKKTVELYWLDIVKTYSAQTAIKKHFRSMNRAMVAAIGCLHLVITLTLSSNTIRKRFHGLVPDIYDLSNLVSRVSHFDNSIKSNMKKYKNMSDFIIQLGNAALVSKEDVRKLLSDLLDIPSETLRVLSSSDSLIWARMQGKNGWDDQTMKNKILLPLLRDILPVQGVPFVEEKWISTIGERSLSNETSPYYKQLSDRLISSRKKAHSNVLPLDQIVSENPSAFKDGQILGSANLATIHISA